MVGIVSYSRISLFGVGNLYSTASIGAEMNGNLWKSMLKTARKSMYMYGVWFEKKNRIALTCMRFNYNFKFAYIREHEMFVIGMAIAVNNHR